MSTSLVLPNAFGSNSVTARYQGQGIANERLGEGISSGYAIVGYKGKVWSIRHSGNEYPLMRDDGDGPRGSIEAVVVKASGVISKVFYENGYTEGSNASPDCMSVNGVTPAVSSPKKQAAACVVCPRNQFKPLPNGKKGKECSDSKRLAIVPLDDVTNEAFGGPMLLRVPAASLTTLKVYGDQMAGYGYPYYFTYGTRIAFDPSESYPKFVFSPIRPLTPHELDDIDQMRGNPDINRIVAEDDPAPATNGGVQWENPSTPSRMTSTLSLQQTQSLEQAGNHTTGEASTQFAPHAASTSENSTPSQGRGSASRTRGKNGGSADTATTSKPHQSAASENTVHHSDDEVHGTGNVDLDKELDSLLAE